MALRTQQTRSRVCRKADSYHTCWAPSSKDADRARAEEKAASPAAAALSMEAAAEASNLASCSLSSPVWPYAQQSLAHKTLPLSVVALACTFCERTCLQ